ncbi:hypothetical protein Leryth_027535 [Lithospermum erythrorhizon]|nr:hypothetical protein Leryth_027535 [Lithospermum erythrorhizon]
MLRFRRMMFRIILHITLMLGIKIQVNQQSAPCPKSSGQIDKDDASSLLILLQLFQHTGIISGDEAERAVLENNRLGKQENASSPFLLLSSCPRVGEKSPGEKAEL